MHTINLEHYSTRIICIVLCGLIYKASYHMLYSFHTSLSRGQTGRRKVEIYIGIAQFAHEGLMDPTKPANLEKVCSHTRSKIGTLQLSHEGLMDLTKLANLKKVFDHTRSYASRNRDVKSHRHHPQKFLQNFTGFSSNDYPILLSMRSKLLSRHDSRSTPNVYVTR